MSTNAIIAIPNTLYGSFIFSLRVFIPFTISSRLKGYSNVPLTTRGNKRVSVIYAHLLPSFQGQVSVLTCRKPKKVILLRTGEDIPFFYCGGSIQFKVSPSCRTKTDDVVKITI